MRAPSRNITSSCSACTVLASSVLLSAPTSAAVALAKASVDNSPEFQQWLVSEPTLSGSDGFYGEAVIDGVTITWNYATDLDPDGIAVINGAMTFLNGTAKTQVVRGTFIAPICPEIVAGTKIGGLAKVTLTADAGGGQVGCLAEEKDFDVAISDGLATKQLFACPFDLSLTGAGNASTLTLFGSPFPSMPGPAFLSDLGHEVAFSLTAGDKATLSLMYVTQGEFVPLEPVECPADLNGDGVVDGGDLPFVLSAMGQIAACGDPADIVLDGVIDGADLAGLLAGWGPCPQAPVAP